MKNTIIYLIVYFVLGFACLIVGGELTESISTLEIWHDALLVISGVFFGCFCAMCVLLKMQLLKKGRREKS